LTRLANEPKNLPLVRDIWTNQPRPWIERGRRGRAGTELAPSGLALQRAEETIGVEFIDENGGGPGVRLRAATRKPTEVTREIPRWLDENKTCIFLPMLMDISRYLAYAEAYAMRLQ